ncbi:anaerobic dimethyl sulfoxide reductase subunit C [Escherichia coli]|uniref:Anaerobic dimethyl sulfoxide reductase subunit C n=1 Tax=Escherichia coli TaxID=562 RepID=A0A376KX63_ECOLX|nr:anaerobic dimethyl sulfoxide reductase subunit C [Escherichia coli]
MQQAAALVPDYGALMSWRIVLLAVALCLWIAPQLKGYQPAVPLLSVSFILLLAGELIRSRRILWFAYDRGDGRRKLISNNRGFGPGSLLFLLR